MRFRIRFDWPDDSVKRFIAEHPNIDILSINTSYTTRDFGVTAIWYTEGNKPYPEMNSGAPEPEKYVIKRASGSKEVSYVLNVRPSYGRALLVDYTEYKMIAREFREKEANELLKKLGNGYEMEEL
jgi:hypothetical protein